MNTLITRSVALLLSCILCLFAIPSYAQAFEPIEVKNPQTGRNFTFNHVAVANLQKLKTILREYGLEEHTETLQAMMMVETQAGTGGSIGLPNAHPSIRSYGLMQVTVPTARTMLRDYEELRYAFFGNRGLKQITNKEIRSLLLQNHDANIRIGIHVFVQYLGMVNGEWARAVAAYNMGIGNALRRAHAPKSPYVANVRKWMPLVAKVNDEVIQQAVRIEVDTSQPVSTPIVDITLFKLDTNDTQEQQKENNDGKEELTDSRPKDQG